jgi:hypothetical protein
MPQKQQVDPVQQAPPAALVPNTVPTAAAAEVAQENTAEAEGVKKRSRDVEPGDQSSKRAKHDGGDEEDTKASADEPDKPNGKPEGPSLSEYKVIPKWVTCQSERCF